MTPYLAIILDSFRAALASWILWIAFIAIWILLAALALVGYREDFTVKFSRWDFDNGTQLKAMLAQGLSDPKQQDEALGRIARAMPTDLTRQLERVAKGEEVRIRTQRLADGLNEAIEDESWYDADAWRATARLRELRELDDTPEDELSEELRQRRARLRIEAALPGVMKARSSRSILVTYAGKDFPAPLPFGKEQFDSIVNQFVLPAIMNWLLGFVLIFLGILVTASIAPEMLQAGSLHLLISKPVSRAMLLISKFTGGCAFVLLCVTQLVVGLWLIAGFRLDIWNPRILLCIPVAVFLFAVFYSVSFLAGLIWRTSIVAIGITCMFGVCLLVIGAIGGYFDGFVTQPDKIRSLVLAGDNLIGTTRGGGVVRYDDKARQWQDLMTETRPEDLVLSVAKLSDDHVVTAWVRGGRYNPYGSGSLDVLVLQRSEDWSPEPGIRLPIATRRLMAIKDKTLFAMNTGGLMRADAQRVIDSVSENEGKSKKKKDAKGKSGNWLADLVRMRGGATKDFQSVLPSGVPLVQPARVVVDDKGKWMIVYSLGRISRLEEPDENGEANAAWNRTANRELPGEAAEATVVAVSGNLVLISRDKEPVMVLDAESLETIEELDLPSGDSIVSATGLHDGRHFVAVMSDGTTRMITSGESGTSIDDLLGFSEVESIAIDHGTNRLLVAHHIDQVDVVDVTSLESVRRIRPQVKGWRLAEQFVIRPLRTLTPQTGELGDTVAALIAGDSAVKIGQNPAEETEVIRRKVMRPVLSCAGFIFVMMLINCWYFTSRDF